jgi:hypothetical protein
MGEKKIDYLKLYNEWIITERLPDAGLCYSLESNSELIDVFAPEGVDSETEYWASEPDTTTWCDYLDHFKRFNPLRQNIILLLAAINNQL